MKKNNHIVFKAVIKNFINICIYYPKMIYMAKHPNKYTAEQLYNYALTIVKKTIDTCHVKIEAYGLENIPQEDGVFLCSNHQEKFDPLVIWYTFPRRIGVVLADRACYRPFIQEICVLVKSRRLIHNDSHSVLQTFDKITEDLQNNENYMIFPEGNYADDIIEMNPFHSGCFRSPLRAKKTILPVALINSNNLFDNGFKTTNSIQIHYLKPIFPNEYEGLSTTELSSLVQNRIKEVVKQYQH